MRVVLLVLLLVVAACSSPAESAITTTGPTTTTTEATVTTAATTTSTTEPECVERDGVLLDSRGFVCPPHLATSRYAPGHLLSTFRSYLPGKYSTGISELGFTFQSGEGFVSSGESIGAVPLDEHPTCDSELCAREIVAFGPETVAAFQSKLGTVEWIEDLVSTPFEYWGATGTQADFTIGDCPLNCIMSLEGPIATWGFQEGHSVRNLYIDVPGGPIGLTIAAHQSRFDTYWTEVVEPILASIEFTDE